MEGKTDRGAAFECVISIAVPSGPALTYEGRCEGEISTEPKGVSAHPGTGVSGSLPGQTMQGCCPGPVGQEFERGAILMTDNKGNR
ncbi:MAG: non-canonical purine NTP pyrophosphatase [Desulfobulbaceae bacterium]